MRLYRNLESRVGLPPVETQYTIEKKIINTDFFISRIRNAREIVIRLRDQRYILEFISEANDILYQIPLESIEEIHLSYQRLGRLSKREDKLIQIVFTDEALRLRTIRVNIQDDQIDDLLNQIRKLKRNLTHDTKHVYDRFCAHCGNKNPAESKFCNHCGQKLQLPCPNCGNMNPETSHFCPKCNSRLNHGTDLTF
jgi:hypothetical protein